jgi:uncharacterized protein YndB with AHSA1/START domain
MQTMLQPAVSHASYTLERNYPASPERVFSFLSDPAKKRRWFGAGDNPATDSFAMDFRVGGRETKHFGTSLDSPLKGATLTNETVYMDIEPARRVVFAYTMAVNGKHISASLATFELIPDGAGTALLFTEQAAFFENSDGPEGRKAGWSSLLDQLEKELKS